jgi:hypothetical protein
VQHGFSGSYSLTLSSGGTTSLGISSPVGTTTWETGTSQTVSWNATSVSGTTVGIYLLRGGTIIDTLASAVSNNGSAIVSVPSTISSGNAYAVMVAGSASGLVTSGTFTILVPSSNYAVTVKLTWNTGVADELDTGNQSDVDLHVVEPDSTDIYFGNMSGIGSLDVDNTWGYGPEYYTIKSPTNGKYQVNVNFYDGWENFPGTAATVVVTVNGALRTYGPHIFTASDFDGTDPGAWWDVCTITMPGGALSKTLAGSAEKNGHTVGATGTSFGDW